MGPKTLEHALAGEARVLSAFDGAFPRRGERAKLPRQEGELGHAVLLWICGIRPIWREPCFSLSRTEPWPVSLPDGGPDAEIRETVHAEARARRLKGIKVAEMKAAGIEYDQRMEELEKLEHPKPNREFIYSTFNAFAEMSHRH